MLDLLVKQKTSPERYPSGVNVLGAERRIWAEPRRIHIQTEVHGHPETHAAVDPALPFSTTAGFPDGHEGQSLNGAEFGVGEFIIFVHQPLGLLEEVVANRCRVVGICAGSRPGGEMTAQTKHGVDEKGGAVLGGTTAEEVVIEELL